MLHLLFAILLCLLGNFPRRFETKILPSKVISFAPSQVDGTQYALIHVFGSRPFNVSYVTWLETMNNTQAINGKECFYSKPRDNVHRVEIQYAPPELLEPGWMREQRIELIVDFCYLNNTCEPLEPTVRLIHRIFVSRNDVLLLIETDKSVYKPSDQMRIRCALLKPGQWTMSRFVNRSKLVPSTDYLTMKTITSNIPIEHSPHMFDSVIIRTETGNIIYQWNNLTQDEARKLNYMIPNKPIAFGDWIVEAKAGDVTKEIRVHMMPDNLNGLKLQSNERISYHLSPDLEYKQEHFDVKLCAVDSAGLVASGPIKVLWCDCHLYKRLHPLDTYLRKGAFLSKEMTDSIINNEACIDRLWENKLKPCIVQSVELGSDGCQSFQFHFEDLDALKLHPLSSFFTPIRCIQIFDASLGQWHRHCEQLPQGRFYRRKSIEIVTPFYKYGLPMRVFIRVNDAYTYCLGADIILEQQLNECKLTANRSLNLAHRITRRVFTEYERKRQFNFTLSPIYTFDPMKIMEKPVDPLSQHSPDLHHNDVLYSFQAPSTSMIQLWPDQGQLFANCNESTRILIMGNQPLSDKQFFVYGSLRATLIPLELENYSLADQREDVNCAFRDDWLGHHEACRPDKPGILDCLPGWHGLGCLEPVCSKHCDPVGGYCTSPGGCECKTGWTGSACDKCVNRYVEDTCLQGDECSCSWYNRTQTMYNSTIPPLMPMTTIAQTYEKIFEPRAIYRRTLRVRLNKEIHGPMPLSIFYLESLKDGQLAVISTHAELLPGALCKNSIGQLPVRFNVTRVNFGSSVELTVTIPSGENENSETACHITVWNELQEDARDRRMWIDSSEPIDRIFIPSSANNSLEFLPPSSFVEFWKCGISEGLDFIEIAQQTFANCTFPKLSLKELDQFQRIQPVSSDKMLFDWFRPTKLQKEGSEFGARFHMKVLPIAASWRATAFCYGFDIGVWTSVSEPLIVLPHFRLNMSVTSSMHLFEVAQVRSSIQFTQIYRSGCSEWSMHITLPPGNVWKLVSAQGYVRCVCDNRTTVVFNTYVRPNLVQVSQLKVHANADLNAPQCILPIDNLLKSNNSIARNDQPLMKQTRIQTITVDTDRTQATNYFSYLFCTNQPRASTNRRSITFNLQNRTGPISQQYLTISLDVAGLLFQQFVLGIQKRLLSGYDHLGMIASGMHLMSYMEREYVRSDRILGNLQSRIYRAIIASIRVIKKLRCLDGSYGPFGGNCIKQDLWYESLAYRMLVLLSKASQKWSIEYSAGFASTMSDNILFRWRLLQDSRGCFMPPTDTPTENRHQVRLTLTAHIWISLSNKPLSDIFLNYIELMMLKARKCVTEILQNEMNINASALTHYNGESLALLARMFTMINTRSRLAKALVNTMRQKQIRLNDPLEQKNNLVHWGSGANEVEATANAYWALRNFGFKSSVLLPVVRWLLSKQMVHGYFSTGLDLYHGASVLLDYSSWIREMQTVTLSIPVRIKIQASNGFEQQIKMHSWDLRTTVVRLPNTDHVNVEIYKPLGHYCVLVTTATFSPGDSEQTVPESKFGMARRINESDCHHVTASICLEQSMLKHVFGLYISGQSGWYIDETTKSLFNIDNKYSNDVIREINFVSECDIHVLLNSSIHNDTSVRLQPYCLELNYTRRGAVAQAKPLIVTAIGTDFLDGKDLYTIRFPECEDYLSNTKLKWIPRNPGVTECPIILDTGNEIKSNLLKHWNQLCDTEITVLHMNQTFTEERNLKPIRVYQIGTDDQITYWSTALSNQASRCGLFDQASTYVALQQPRTDMHPEDEILNLRAAPSEQHLPIKLLRMDRGNQGMNEILRSLIEPCKTLQTMIRLVYGKLI